MLSMANKGKDTNASQFFICFSEAKHLDTKHVVFGQTVKNIEFQDRLENLEIEGEDSKPKEEVVIVGCGVVE